jgi:hypothetical protein
MPWKCTNYIREVKLSSGKHQESEKIPKIDISKSILKLETGYLV